MHEILAALKQYIKDAADIPAPADLKAIIDPKPEPLSAAVYYTIRKKITDDNVFVTQAELDYCYQFEARELAKISDKDAFESQYNPQYLTWRN